MADLNIIPQPDPSRITIEEMAQAASAVFGSTYEIHDFLLFKADVRDNFDPFNPFYPAPPFIRLVDLCGDLIVVRPNGTEDIELTDRLTDAVLRARVGAM